MTFFLLLGPFGPESESALGSVWRPMRLQNLVHITAKKLIRLGAGTLFLKRKADPYSVRIWLSGRIFAFNTGSIS